MALMRLLLRSALALVIVATVACAGQGQVPPPAATPNPDGKSIDTIIAALYDVISGPAGKKRDWDRFRALFWKDGRMQATVKGRDNALRLITILPDEYAQRSGPYLEKEGFFEKEIARRQEQYGSIAHVFSTYESLHKADDKKPFERGINSIQLFNDGQRWWVLSVYWQGEGAGVPLPAKYLKRG
jgi:hypothetical protein